MAWPTPDNINFRLTSICESGEDRIFQKFDELHKLHIDDTQVIRWLRENGRKELAEGYIEWSGALDPDSDVSNTTTNPDSVTDPGTNPSDLQMQAAHATAALTEELLRHEFVGGGFNIVCKCGYVGKDVSLKGDFQRHVAQAVVEAGWKK